MREREPFTAYEIHDHPERDRIEATIDEAILDYRDEYALTIEEIVDCFYEIDTAIIVGCLGAHDKNEAAAFFLEIAQKLLKG